MTVYIEYVLIDNFIIDYCLLKAAFALCGLRPHKGRLFLCAFLGAGFALVYPLIVLPDLFFWALKVAFGVLLVFLCAGKLPIKKTAKISAFFLGLTFFTGGAITGVCNLLGIKEQTEVSVALMFLPVYILLKTAVKLIFSAIKTKREQSFVFAVKIFFNGAEEECKGLMDTGNSVYYNGEPVAVISEKLFKKLLMKSDGLKKADKIVLSTVSGQSENISFIVDKLEIYFSDKPNIFNNIRVAVVRGALNYDVILHPAFSEVENAQKSFEPTEKVS